MTNSPIINLHQSIKLLNMIADCHQDFKLVIKPLSKCMIFIQSLLSNPSKLTSQDNLMVISRSILLSCIVVYECNFIERIQDLLQYDMKAKLSESLKKIIMLKDVEQTILDIVLEGLSYIWLKYPEQITDRSTYQS